MHYQYYQYKKIHYTGTIEILRANDGTLHRFRKWLVKIWSAGRLKGHIALRAGERRHARLSRLDTHVCDIHRIDHNFCRNAEWMRATE